MRIHYLDHAPDRFMVTYGKEPLARLPAVADTLFAMEEFIPESDLAGEGATLAISRSLLATPIGMEAFKHCVYLNTVFHTYPRISTKAPARGDMVKPDDYEHHLNSLKNLPVFENINHVTALAQACHGMTALLIQPGPSFDPGFISGLRDSCLLVAIARTLPKLLEHGIIPDFIYQQDTSSNSWDVSFGCVKDSHIPSVLVANPAGHLHAFADSFAAIYKSWNFYPFETDQMPCLIDSIPPSTTTGALSLALHLGCTTIISHGGDFGDVIKPDAMPEGSYLEGYPAKEDGDLLIFEPPSFVQFDIRIRRPGKPCLRTSSDYLSASQWIKRKALHLKLKHPGHRILDHSRTGLLTDLSPIEPYLPGAAQGPKRSMELTRYRAPFPWRGYAATLLRRYQGIRRILASSGTAPQSALESPYNALFSGMAEFRGTPFPLAPENLQTALDRAGECIALLDALLAGQRSA